MTTRRTFLKVLSGAALASVTGLPPRRALAEVALANANEFFVFLWASGGWDVTLWADPRNETKGLVQPASSDNTDSSGVHRWVDVPLENNVRTFELVRPRGSNLVLGPGIGDLAEMADRLTVVNGLAMNTVAHPDGATFSTTGRHPQNNRSLAPSIDTVLANEFGKDQLLPNVSIRFPSSYVGDNLDRRVVPMSMDDMGAITKSLARAQLYDSNSERDRVTVMLSEEARDLAKRSTYPNVLDGLSLQYQSLRRMLGTDFNTLFNQNALRAAHPELKYTSRFTSGPALNAAFALEAIKKNLVRCVSLTVDGFDTHGGNYRTHAALLQDMFDLVAQIVRALDSTPHPTKQGSKLADHTHLMVVSEFCRTPQINTGQGRDHYPNNSSLVISPRFRGNFVFGKTDPDQLLPAPAKKFVDGERAIAPPDLLATFVSAFGVDPRKYMRDGEVVEELLST
jgi:hypothetical protein